MSKTPKLRFKEFSGDWEIKKLGELGEFIKTYSFSRSVEGEGNYKHIHYGDIHMNYKGIISKNKLIPSINIPSYNNYEFIQERDIIFADASEDRKDLGKVAVVRNIEGNVLSGLHTFCFRPKEDLNSEFFLNHSLNNGYLKFMYTKGNGAKVLGISKSNLSEYKFLAPSIQEQEKIASFFSLIDDKIYLQGEKVEALKDYKKGIMQKIFSRELRFKDDDGRDYPEWISCKVGDCFSERSERGFEDLELLSVSMQNGVIRRSDIEGKDNSSENKSNYKLVKVDDIVYNSMRMWQGASGLSKFEGIVSPAYTILIPKNNVCSKYFAYLFKMEKIIYEFRKYSQGLTSDTWNLKYPQIKDIKVKLPSYDEQVKISNFIENIDNKIRKEQDKLDSLNGYKKGLLQQMFI